VYENVGHGEGSSQNLLIIQKI